MSYNIKLEVFEGPLDLLLYFIKRDEINIYDIPIAKITEEYLNYLQLMRDMNLRIAGEFILMAAVLIKIKLQMLLPSKEEIEEIEVEDPRSELVRMLEEYQKYRRAGEYLKILWEDNLKFHPVSVDKGTQGIDLDLFLSDVNLYDLAALFKRFLESMQKNTLYEIEGIKISVSDKIQQLRSFFVGKKELKFSDLRNSVENRFEIIITFLAILEMVKNGEVVLKQNKNFEDIIIKCNKEKEVDAVANT
ncbi:MAG: segregation/condensation protein A [Candidatus Marinimicrobia bacterium]|nr:segregation/condensation protein A [Candidatus Neomarinimicrobiota bacterium]